MDRSEKDGMALAAYLLVGFLVGTHPDANRLIDGALLALEHEEAHAGKDRPVFAAARALLKSQLGVQGRLGAAGRRPLSPEVVAPANKEDSADELLARGDR